jgi:PmbA protein
MMKILEKMAAVAELYQELRQGATVVFRGGEIEQVGSEEVLGRALRVIVDGRLGFASTAGEEEEGLIEAAMTSARHGDPAPFRFPTLRGGSVEVLDEEVLGISPDELLTLGEEAVRTIQGEFPELVVDVSLSRGVTEVSLQNSSGGECRERRSYLAMGIEVERIREDDIWLLYASRIVRRRADLEPEALVGKVLRNLRWGERTVAPPTGTPRVLFLPTGTLALLLPLLVGFSGLSVYLGTSPLKGRLGEQGFDHRLTIVDDGTLPFGPRSCSFDDEGLATTRLPWVEDGVVRSFFYDLRTAALAAAEPTGNGMKGSPLGGGGFRTPPAPGPRNIMVRPGEGSLEELIADMGEGLIVADVIGLGQGNIQSGAFSGNVGVGFAVRDGKVVGRVKNTMIAGNAYEVLRDGLQAIGGEAEWVHGALHAPPLLVEGVSVVSR